MSDEAKTKAAEDSAAAHSPLETLTSLVLDAADAANDSAQSTQEAIKRLTQVVETNEATTRAVRNAPAIFGAIMMSVGIVMAVVVAMVFSKLNERATALDEAIAKQAEGLEKVERTLKDLALLESNLEKFQKIADDTTQRAVVTLREQVKTDRLALQQLEVRRLNEMLASLRGAVEAAPRPGPARQSEEVVRLAALEKAVARLESGKLGEVEKSIARLEGERLVSLEKFQKIADDTTQRAVVTLREQVKTDRLALQQLEVRRLNEMLASLRGAVEAAPRPGPVRQSEEVVRLAALEKAVTRIDFSKLEELEKSIAGLEKGKLATVESGIAKIDARLAAMEKSAKAGSAGGSTEAKRPVAVLSDAQAKDMKTAVAEIGRLKTEVASLRALIEQRTSDLQSGVPAIRKSGG